MKEKWTRTHYPHDRILSHHYALQIAPFYLEVLLTKRPEQVNLRGDRGKTPLHYAALVDNAEAVEILVRLHSLIDITAAITPLLTIF